MKVKYIGLSPLLAYILSNPKLVSIMFKESSPCLKENTTLPHYNLLMLFRAIIAGYIQTDKHVNSKYAITYS
jgi:hypothetical protein